MQTGRNENLLDITSDAGSSIRPSRQELPPPNVTIRTNTDLSGAYASALVTAGLVGTRGSTLSEEDSVRPLQRGAPPKEPATVSPANHHATRARFESCVASVSRAIDDVDDPILLANAITQLHASLAEIWSRRAGQGEALEEAVNMVQNLLLGREPEDFTVDELRPLKSALQTFAEARVMSDDVVNRVTIALLRSGVDVFREIV